MPCSVFKDDANHLSFSLLYCSVTIRINVRPPPQRPGRSPAAMAAARARSSPARTPRSGGRRSNGGSGSRGGSGGRESAGQERGDDDDVIVID